MPDNKYVKSILKDIKLDKIDIEIVIEDIKKNKNIDDILFSIHQLIADELYLNDLSTLCGLIKGIDNRKSLPVLWKLILDDSTKNRRGSLLYAMEDMNPIEYLEQLIDLVLSDNFEVLSNSMAIIDNLEGYIDGDTLEKCILKIESALEKPMQEWRKEALILLIEEFEEE
ncbi:hypothetical protein [Thalassomonas haliotis]|uniref:HEAT repeat domain-containing protein n=1 Tax=Thalassomonas haliotis TaxID=485448 RepID=A0ABY7VB64_9GAMM|nr:hypothetical protein [Thalassomonas haliotis]WDE10480.1 hypothetical protein H3N35_19765 [Thalassomonas haliotis]